MGRRGVSGMVIRAVVGVLLFLGSYLIQPFVGAPAYAIYWGGLLLLAMSALELVIRLLGALVRAVSNWIMKPYERERIEQERIERERVEQERNEALRANYRRNLPSSGAPPGTLSSGVSRPVKSVYIDEHGQERCYACDKVVFADWEAAQSAALHQLNRGRLQRAYQESRCGNWHLTSQPPKR